MLKKWPKLISFIEKHFLLIILFGYLLLTLPALLDTNHFLYNLEPYPDGILYSLSGKSFWLGNGLKLIFEFGEKSHWVPPIYSVILGVGAITLKQPFAFYLTNILIQVLFLSTFYWILKQTTKSKWIRIIGMLSLLGHSLLFLLPSIPMTENLTIFFFTLMIASFFVKGNKKFILMALSVVGMLFTRYSIFPVIMGGIIIIPLLSLRNINVFNFVKSVLSNNSSWQGTRFIFLNLITYAKMLFLNKGLFLWLNIGLTNFIFTGMFFTSLFVLFKKKMWQKFWILFVLFFAQFPLQLVFYVADARYLIYSIPLVVLGVVWLIDALPKKRRLLIPMAIFGIFLQLFMQRSLVRQIVADNLLGRSTAWQYEAIKHFDSVLKNDSLVITALPPFLVDAYQEKSYRALPLSYTQEFMNKKQYIWGGDLNHANLTESYKQWINEGKTIHISNSYITHHKSVINDFEKFKEEFSFELISSGCENACNIYKLDIRDTNNEIE